MHPRYTRRRNMSAGAGCLTLIVTALAFLAFIVVVGAGFGIGFRLFA